MWAKPKRHVKADRVCYIFHHFSGAVIDRTHIAVADAGYGWEPALESDADGCPTWFLFRSIPQRLCSHAGERDRCPYALGATEFSNGMAGQWQHADCMTFEPPLP